MYLDVGSLVAQLTRTQGTYCRNLSHQCLQLGDSYIPVYVVVYLNGTKFNLCSIKSMLLSNYQNEIFQSLERERARERERVRERERERERICTDLHKITEDYMYML